MMNMFRLYQCCNTAVMISSGGCPLVSRFRFCDAFTNEFGSYTNGLQFFNVYVFFCVTVFYLFASCMNSVLQKNKYLTNLYSKFYG